MVNNENKKYSKNYKKIHQWAFKTIQPNEYKGLNYLAGKTIHEKKLALKKRESLIK
jgi:hypothetical protein